MDEAPNEATGSLKLLRALVTALLGVMIVGFIVLIGLFVTRLPGTAPRPALPDTITLPDGARATAFTQGTGWFAVVTEDQRILIFDRAEGTLLQEVEIRYQQ